MTAALRLVPAPLPESTVPAWRSRLVGVYTDADELAEREVLGWLLCGGEFPRWTEFSKEEAVLGLEVPVTRTWSVALRCEHFASRFNRQLFVACSAARATDGAVLPWRVLECLRFYGHTRPSVAHEMAQLMEESLEFTEPPSFQSFLERAELRLRVLRLEREAEVLRRSLR